MNRIVLFGLLFLLVGGIWLACKRVDDEPRYPAAPISRLYVSYSDLESSDTQQLYNIEVFDPADSLGFIPNPQRTRTRPNRGMGVAFSPHLGLAFQVSWEDTTVMSFTVSETGNLASSRNFRDTVYLHNPRAIRYDNRSDCLFLTNDNPDTASINVYYNPVRLVNQQAPRKRMQLIRARPWGISIAGLPRDNQSNQLDSVVLLTMRGTGEVWAFEKNSLVTGAQFDSTSSPTYKLTITGASNLRGITYSRNLDMLFLTDLGTDTTGRTADGNLFIIEGAAAAIRAGGTIAPSRTITGSSTRLLNPIDVAVADSTDRNQFIYVAERTGRQLLRFTTDASGDAEPEMTKSLSLTPEFIFMDLR